MPSSDMTSGDQTRRDLTSSDTTSSDQPKTAAKSGVPVTRRKGGRRNDAPKPLTVFTGSHGLQAGKPRAGEDTNPDDTTDPDSRPDVRR